MQNGQATVMRFPSISWLPRRQDFNHQARGAACGSIDPLGRLAKILWLGGRNVHERLWVAVNQREPGTLHLDHHPVPGAEGVKDVGNGKLDGCYLAGLERLGLVQAVAEPAAKHIPTDKLLVTAHSDAGRIWVGVRIIAGKDIYELDHPVGIGACGRDMQGRLEWPREGEV